MASLTEKLRQLFQQKFGLGKSDMKQRDQAAAAFPLDEFDKGEFVTANNVSVLMHMLAHTEESEYSCAETFALLDQYVEAAVRSRADAEAIMPLVKRHLDVCPDCFKEFEALLRILQTD